MIVAGQMQILIKPRADNKNNQSHHIAINQQTRKIMLNCENIVGLLFDYTKKPIWAIVAIMFW